MRLVWVFLACVVVLAGTLPVAAQPVRVLAVVDFVDETADGKFIGASRLSAELTRDLQDAAGGRMRVMPVDTVRAAMAARGYTTRDIFNTTKMVDLAAAVGADWIVTGRWMHLDSDWITFERPSPGPLLRYAVGSAMIEIRVIEAPSRRVMLADSFSESVQGFGPPLLILQAARTVLRQVALKIARL